MKGPSSCANSFRLSVRLACSDCSVNESSDMCFRAFPSATRHATPIPSRLKESRVGYPETRIWSSFVATISRSPVIHGSHQSIVVDRGINYEALGAPECYAMRVHSVQESDEDHSVTMLYFRGLSRDSLDFLGHS